MHTKTFKSILDKLFQKRTQWLYSIATGRKKPGKLPRLASVRDKTIEELQKVASEIWVNKLFADEFKKYAGKRKQWTIQGWGGEDEKKRCEDWFRKIGNPKNCIYVFLGNNNRVIYVGRTGRGGCRPSAHLTRKGFSPEKISIFPVKSPSQLHKLECLAIHHFNPVKNKKKSAKQEMSKRCPLCIIHNGIESEIRKIFRMR